MRIGVGDGEVAWYFAALCSAFASVEVERPDGEAFWGVVVDEGVWEHFEGGYWSV